MLIHITSVYSQCGAVVDDERVGDGDEVLRPDQRDVEGRLQGRFVKARESPSGVCGLKLGGYYVPDKGANVTIIKSRTVWLLCIW